MKDKTQYIKCDKCGFAKNLRGSKKCIKCGNLFQRDFISCPKCALKNKVNVKKCVNCGYSFNGKNVRNIISLIISIVVIIIMGILVFVNNRFVINNMKWMIRGVGIIGIIMIMISTLFYGKEQQLLISAEEKMNDKKFRKFKFVSSLSVIMGILLVTGIVIFICFT